MSTEKMGFFDGKSTGLCGTRSFGTRHLETFLLMLTINLVTGFVEFFKNCSIVHKLFIKYFDEKMGVTKLICQINAFKEQFAAKRHCFYGNT